MSSFGKFFSSDKLQINQRFNTKSYTYDASAEPPATGEKGDVWFILGNTASATSNGVYVHTGTQFVQVASMNA